MNRQTFKQYLLENRTNQDCIVVDIQPEYVEYMGIRWIPDLMEFLNKQNKILMFVNAEDQGATSDTVDDIKIFWHENGFDENKFKDVIVEDKGYGYLRSWMDFPHIKQSAIIKTIREMHRQRVNSSDELFGGWEHPDYVKNMTEQLDVPEDLLDDTIYTEWTSIAQLKRFNGSLMMGGAKDECLREVQLLMNAFNIRYREVNKFIY